MGNSLSEFMRKLDIYSTDGKAHKRLRNQMERLFKAAIVLEYDGPGETARVGSLVTDQMHLWWDERKPDAPVLWESTIELGEKFFEEIIRHPVPLDLHVLKRDEAVLVGPRPLPVVDLSHVRAQESDAVVMEGALSAVRRGPGQGDRPAHR